MRRIVRAGFRSRRCCWFWPELENQRRAGPLAQLEAQGMRRALRINGQGHGRMLLALKDGRVLQNTSTIHENLTARLPAPAGVKSSAPEPVTLEIDSETRLGVDEAAEPVDAKPDLGAVPPNGY